MRVTTIFKSSAVATLVALLVAASTAFADRDDKGKGGDRGGGDRGGGGQSISGGERSGGERSSRSFIGGSNQSSRSTIRSSDSDRNIRVPSDGNRSSTRTYRGNQDSDGRSIRSSDSTRTVQPSDRTFQFKPDQSGSQLRQGNQYQVRRPTERSQKDRELVDREFKQWQNTWTGQKGDGRDHRDWSGSWRDSDRFTTADRIRRDWHDRNDRDRVFGDDWWRDRHRGDYWTWWGDYGRRHNRPWYWWSWTPAPRLGSWLVYGWPTPYYWDYGPGEYISYDNGAIYVNGRWYEPAPVYYDQTVRLIDQAPDLTAEDAAKLEWMPLGVFAVTPDGRGEADTIVQLAVTKDGVIGGTAFDQKTGAAYNIQGLVDKRSQRAVWSYADDRNKRIVMETSVYNLTQPEATGLVHYGPNDMKVVELVRLQEPGSGGSSAAPTAAQGNLPPPAVEK